MEDSMDMDISPLRPQKYLFGKCLEENVGARSNRAWWLGGGGVNPTEAWAGGES